MAKKTISELKTAFSSGKKPTGQDFADLIDSTYDTPLLEEHDSKVAPHQYGSAFEWRYNPGTKSLDLVVLK